MKFEKNIKKTIGDWLSTLSEGQQTKYVFSTDELKDIKQNELVILMSKFSTQEEFKELYAAVMLQTKNVIVVCPDSITVKEARSFSKTLHAECPTFVCTDGLLIAPVCSKGFTMSLTLPVWNEAETLREVIESFLPVCDEVIIGIDDKTNDGSFEIAEEFSDVVFKYKWEKSFSKARNECLKRCTSEWVFMTEGHEFLQESSYSVFKFIKNAHPEVALINVKRVIAEARCQFSMFPWITRNIPEVKYIYDSHNAVLSTHDTICAQVNLPEIITFHQRSQGKEDVRTNQRKGMNRVNLLKDLQKNKNDPRALFYLANEYFSFKEFEKAIEYYKRYISISDFAEEKYQAKLSCARCLKMAGRDKDATEMLMECFKEPIPRNDHMIYLGEHFYDTNISLAIHYFKLAACVEEPVSPMWIESAFYLDYPLKRLCSIYTKVGRLKDAKLCIDILRERGCADQALEEVDKEISEAMEDEDKIWDSYHDMGLDIEKLSVSCV